jgi:hypothetical protein
MTIATSAASSPEAAFFYACASSGAEGALAQSVKRFREDHAQTRSSWLRAPFSAMMCAADLASRFTPRSFQDT